MSQRQQGQILRDTQILKFNDKYKEIYIAKPYLGKASKNIVFVLLGISQCHTRPALPRPPLHLGLFCLFLPKKSFQGKKQTFWEI